MRSILVLALIGLAAAQSPGNGISKTTYSCNDPIPMKEFFYKYFPVATPGDECADDLCQCAAVGSVPAWTIEQGRVYALTSTDSSMVQGGPGNGFGVHCVNVSNHLTTGGMSTAAVEKEFTDKLADLSTRYDSFLDYNAMFYTSGLADYVSTFKADGVPMYTTTWEYQGKTWTSVFIHVPDTQVNVELCQDTTLDGVEVNAVHPFPRASERAMQQVLSMVHPLDEVNKTLTVGAVIYPLAVNRAVSDATLDLLDEFYVTGMGTTKSEEQSSNGVSKKCYLWPGASVDICFYNRAETETKGNFKVANFEEMLKTVHENILGGHPLCGEDKWFDNHYAIDSFSADATKIVAYVEANNIIHYCAAMGPWSSVSLHYVFDPTGWGIQLDINAGATSDCTSAANAKTFKGFGRNDFRGRKLLQGHSNPACDPGTCRL